LRNPLGTILTLASLLKRREGEPEGPSQATAEAIERASFRMDRLIRDLLDVTRMEAGRLTVERERISTGQVISDCVEAQKPLVASVFLDLDLEMAPNLPDIWADRHRLLQIVENLIGNAAKFTGSGGRIAVGARPEDRDVLFWVRDTGIGIAAADLP